jgi:hypothetical protein
MLMRRMLLRVLPALLLVSSLCHGQSLGETARQLRQQKNTSRTAAKKVVTTDDLSPSPDPKPGPDSKPPKEEDVKPASFQWLGTAKFTPEMWTRAIRAEKGWIAHLQEEAEKLKTERAVDLNKVATDPEERKLWGERQIQQQCASDIPGEQKKLQDMEEAARKAGMPPAVRSPQ